MTCAVTMFTMQRGRFSGCLDLQKSWSGHCDPAVFESAQTSGPQRAQTAGRSISMMLTKRPSWGLPEEVALDPVKRGHVIAVKETVISGLVLDDRSYTREAAARAIGEVP
jgi:hypothetical protein